MQQISQVEALKLIKARQKAGNHIDKRLLCAVEASTALFFLTLEDKATFLSLIWQEIDDSRLLTPGGPRTLRDVVQRMIDQSWTFEKLTADLGVPKNQHKPEW